MKKGLIIVSLFVLFSFSFGKKIAVFDFDDRSGETNPQSMLIEKMINEKFPEYNVNQYNAMGDEQRGTKLLKQIESENYDLAVIITTDATMMAIHFLRKTKFVFTNANNPEFFGVKMEKPGKNFSGITYYVPIEKQLDYFRTIKPSIKSIGFIFDDNAKSRRYELQNSRTYCNKNKIKFEAALVTSSAQVESATKKLLSKGVDAIVISTSGKVYNETENIVKLSDSKNIPVFSYHKKAVPLGAVASLTSDYTIMNTELLPKMLEEILIKNKNPGNLSVDFLKIPIETVNKEKLELYN